MTASDISPPRHLRHEDARVVLRRLQTISEFRMGVFYFKVRPDGTPGYH